MEARVYDSIHIEVQVVELTALRVGLRCVNWDCYAVYLSWLLFDNIYHNLRIPGIQS